MGRWLILGACVLAVAAAGVGVAAGTGDSPATTALPAPDTIVHHGRITTMDGRGSTVQALAIRDGEIVAAGGDAEVKDLAGGKTRLIDLGGRRVLPGLIDSHLEGVRMGSSSCYSRSPRFDALYKRSEALMDVADRAQRTPAGKWLFQIGGAWNVAQFDSPGMLTRAELDAIAPSHLVYLQGTGVPGGQLNTPAMRKLGLEAGDPGVVRNSSGMATGQVTGPANERAIRAIAAELNRLTLDEQESCTTHLIRELNRRGLTAWDDPGGDLGYEAVNRLHRAGELNARIRLNFPLDAIQVSEVGDDTLRIGGVGAGVLRPGAKGVYPPPEYRRILQRLSSRELSFEHGATRATTQHGLVAEWEQANQRHPITDLRWRMLHPGAGPTEPNPDALARLQALNAGVVPTDMAATGGRAHPPYRRIYESATESCLGSGGLDGAPYPPFVNLWYAISGLTYDPNRGGVAEDQRLTREQALAMATTRCDWFMGLDDRVGSLTVGRLADLIVLSDDYFTVPVDGIRTLTSVLTMVGGRVVYGEGPYEQLEQ
jgi:predicted amidohydrolase YtcJ